MILSHNKGADASWCKGRPTYVVFFPTDVLSLIKVLAIKINLHSFINSVKLFTLYFTQCKVLRTNNQSRSLSPVWILGTHEQYIFQSGWFTQVVKRSQVPKQQIFTNTPGTDSFEKPLFFLLPYSCFSSIGENYSKSIMRVARSGRRPSQTWVLISGPICFAFQ